MRYCGRTKTEIVKKTREVIERYQRQLLAYPRASFFVYSPLSYHPVLKRRMRGCHEMLKHREGFFYTCSPKGVLRKWIDHCTEMLRLPVYRAEIGKKFVVGYVGPRPHFVWYFLRAGLLNYKWRSRLLKLTDKRKFFKAMLTTSLHKFGAHYKPIPGCNMLYTNYHLAAKTAKKSWLAGFNDSRSERLDETYYRVLRYDRKHREKIVRKLYNIPSNDEGFFQLVNKGI